MRLIAALACGLALAPGPTGAADRAPDLAGIRPGMILQLSIGQVVDGDTLRARTPRNSPILDIRLWGIDAPEHDATCLDQAGTPYDCGLHAAAVLAAALGGTPQPCRWQGAHGYCFAAAIPLRCEVIALDRQWSRPVARCFTGGTDLGWHMVRAGWARATEPQLAPAQVAASAERLGLHANQSTPWRQPAPRSHR